jgi:hypothetical protein
MSCNWIVCNDSRHPTAPLAIRCLRCGATLEPVGERGLIPLVDYVAQCRIFETRHRGCQPVAAGHSESKG